MSNASVRKKSGKIAAWKKERATSRISAFMWLSRFFSMLCFVLVFTGSVLALSLLHMTKEAEVDSVLATAPTYSDNLAYFEPLHPDMPTMDVLAEMFVRQYVTVRNNVYPHLKEMKLTWSAGGIVYRMSSLPVFEAFYEKEFKKYFQDEEMEFPPKEMVDTDIKKIIKEGWNSWQIFFDTHKMGNVDDVPIIEHWIATIQFRYYASNAFMHNRLRNPLGFTVTQYHLATQKQ